MATYKEIQQYVKNKYGYYPKGCWIAHMKELSGIKIKISHRRYDENVRTNPCPENKMKDIKEAFIHFGMLKK